MLLPLQCCLLSNFNQELVRKRRAFFAREKGLSTNACVEVNPNEAQKDETENFVVMDYTRIISILTKAIQEQQAQIDELKAKIVALEAD